MRVACFLLSAPGLHRYFNTDQEILQLVAISRLKSQNPLRQRSSVNDKTNSGVDFKPDESISVDLLSRSVIS